jgi:hypothetical protein
MPWYSRIRVAINSALPEMVELDNLPLYCLSGSTNDG